LFIDDIAERKKEEEKQAKQRKDVDDTNETELGSQKKLKLRYKQKKVKFSKVVKVHPVRGFKNEHCIQLKNGFTDYFEIKGLNLESLQDTEKVSAILAYSFFLRKYHEDFKLIFMSFPANTRKQIELVTKKIKTTNDPLLYDAQVERRNELTTIQKSLLHQEFYVQIFGKTEKKLDENRRLLLSCSRKEFDIIELPAVKKLQILYKLGNLNSDYMEFDDENRDWQSGFNKDGYDEEVLGYIQPQGGFGFSERCMRKGDGFEACLHMIGYPRKPLPFWANGIFNRNDLVTIVDVHNISKESLLPDLDKSVEEQEARFDEATKSSQREKARSELQSLLDLIRDVIRDDECGKEFHTRMYLYAPALDDLEKKVISLQKELTPLTFNSRIFLSEAKYEWLALFTSYSEQKMLMRRTGQEIKALSLAGGYPFDFSQLIDPRGLYMGYTDSKGVVVLDMTHKDAQRLSYNYSLFGTMGSGKSSTLKKIADFTNSMGNNCFIFAVSAEFNRFCRQRGGTTMNMSGSDGTVNPWQPFATVVDDDTNEIDEYGSFMAWKDALKTNYLFLAGEVGETKEDIEFISLAGKFYDSLGFDMSQITQYPNDAYPTYSDFLHWLVENFYTPEGEFKEEVNSFQAKRIDRIRLAVENIVSTYSRLFDQKTSLPNLDTIKFGVFNLESLLKQRKNVFNAQLFSVFNMVWDHAIKVGHLQKKAYDLGEIDLSDVVYTNIIWDEFHNTVKSGNLIVLEALDRLEREGRKYFCQVGLASQNFDDVLPQNVTGEIEKILTAIFGNTTYKFIMKQTPEATDRIARAFKSQLSNAELDLIPRLPVGKTILNIAGYGNIHFWVELTNSEKAIFDGGA
jgi:hypothetical protein